MNVDLEAATFSPEQAEEVLALLYRTYHGRDRTVDETARKDLLPLLTDHGAAGLAWVTDIIVHSDEMNARVIRDLTALWQEGCWREPTESEAQENGKWLRFLGERGKAVLQAKIALAEEVRQKASQLTGAGLPKEALAELEKELPNVIAGRWVFWHEHGLALYRQGRYADAMPSYEKAIDYCRDDTYFWSCDDLRWCYSQQAEQGGPVWLIRGVRYFTDLTERLPQRWSAWHQRAWLTWKTEGPEDAISLYHRAIARNPDDNFVASCDDLRQCYQLTKRQDEGLEYFTFLAAERPRCWPAWHNVALLNWHHRGDRKAAIEHYKEAIARHPEGGWFWSWQDMGRCLNDLGRHAEAREAHQRASQIDANRWEPWHGMGWAARRLELCDQALEYYKKSLLIYPQCVWSWWGIGSCYRSEAMRRPLLAWLAYRKALEVEPSHQESQQAVAELEANQSPWTELRKLIDKRLDVDELKVLCFDVGVDWDGLTPGQKSARIAELLKILLQRGRIMDIVVWMQRERPDVIPNLV